MLRTMLRRLSLVRKSGVASEKATNRTMPATVVARLRLCSARRTKDRRAVSVVPPASSSIAAVSVSSASSKSPAAAPGTLLMALSQRLDADDHLHDLVGRGFLLAADSDDLATPEDQDPVGDRE